MAFASMAAAQAHLAMGDHRGLARALAPLFQLAHAAKHVSDEHLQEPDVTPM
jgi:hypothetical protein